MIGEFTFLWCICIHVCLYSLLDRVEVQTLKVGDNRCINFIKLYMRNQNEVLLWECLALAQTPQQMDKA